MSINGQLGRAGTRHFEAELASHLRVIDDAIAILGPSSLTQLTMRDALRAAHGMQTIGISLDNKSIVTVSHILGNAIDLVAAHPASISDQAMIHVKAIACALRRLVVGMTEGGDPRSQLSSTWSNVQALRLL
jgi:hypothetical protein